MKTQRRKRIALNSRKIIYLTHKIGDIAETLENLVDALNHDEREAIILRKSLVATENIFRALDMIKRSLSVIEDEIG